MKAIFLNKSPQAVEKVYPDEVVAALQRRVSLSEKVYTKEDLMEDPRAFADVEVVFSTWGMPAMTEEEIGICFPSLKAVFYAAGSVQSFARPFLAKGVKVFSAWAANAVPVAEMTVAQIVLSNKGYFLASRLFDEHGKAQAAKAVEGCKGNYGETVGIIGAGMIGRLVIEMLKAYQLRVLVFDPFLPAETAAELGVELCDLQSLFERSFVVSNHLANNQATRGMLDYGLFCRMRKSATFINTGRGAQVVEDDLVRILEERPDLTALLDVTYPEPPVEGHPFYRLKNCILSPHIAGSAGDEVHRMAMYMQRELEAFLEGRPCHYEVTEAMLATMA